jgi:nucleoside-diphosphate kinase
LVERTLVILKPDAVQRGLLGRIVGRFEDKGLQVMACKLMRISRELGQRHYAPHRGKPFFEPLLQYMTSGPVLVLVLQGPQAIAQVRKMMGATFASQAEPGTIRGDFGCAPGTLNLIHGSDAPESAATEIGLFFGPEELVEYELTNQPWLYVKE